MLFQWQVEDVSYWESSDKTDGNYIQMLEKTAVMEPSVEPMKCAGTVQYSDLQEKLILQANDGNVLENEACWLSKQTENCQTEVKFLQKYSIVF